MGDALPSTKGTLSSWAIIRRKQGR
jgi:hypothetical protein